MVSDRRRFSRSEVEEVRARSSASEATEILISALRTRTDVLDEGLMKVEFEHRIPVKTKNGEIVEGCPVIEGLPHSLTVLTVGTGENRKEWMGLPSSMIPGGDKE